MKTVPTIDMEIFCRTVRYNHQCGFSFLFVPYLNKITFADLANKEKLCRRNGLQSPNDRYGNVLSHQISIGLPYGYMIHMGKYVFRLIMCVIQRKILSRTLDLRIPYRDSEFFSLSTLVTRRKTTFSISLPS